MKKQGFLDKLLKQEIEDGFVNEIRLTKKDPLYKNLAECPIIKTAHDDRRIDAYSLMEAKKLKMISETPYYVLMLNAGRNGNGNWVEYLNQLAILFRQLESHYENVWLIKLENDCPDDVHYVYLGVQNKKGE